MHSRLESNKHCLTVPYVSALQESGEKINRSERIRAQRRGYFIMGKTTGATAANSKGLTFPTLQKRKKAYGAN